MANGKADYYDILGIDKSASAGEIKAAYKKQALLWHPDKHKDDKEAAEKRFKEINEAYQVLSDPEKKRAYDNFGHQAFSPGGQPFGSAQSRWGPFTYTYSTNTVGENPFSGFDFGDPFEIFEQFFGGGSPFGTRSTRIPRYSIDIDFMEAVSGAEKEVSIEGKKHKIKIPAGVDDGSRIRFDDFILSINVKPHSLFERDGSDVFVKIFIPFSTACLGGEILVPTLDGEIKIKVRKGVQSGTMMRLRGKGIPILHGRGRGDQYIRLIVDVPKELSREQRRLLEQLSRKGL